MKHPKSPIPVELSVKLDELGLLSDPQVTISDGDMTYVKSYDHLREHFASGSLPNKTEFTALAHAAFGWMPTILDLRINRWKDVKGHLRKLGKVNISSSTEGLHEIRKLRECIRTRASNGTSVIGLSKILHFLYPNIWPIWDKRSGTTWGGFYSKYKCVAYCRYAYELRSVVVADVANDVTNAVNKELKKHLLPPVGPLRALEMALFIKGKK